MAKIRQGAHIPPSPAPLLELERTHSAPPFPPKQQKANVHFVPPPSLSPFEYRATQLYEQFRRASPGTPLGVRIFSVTSHKPSKLTCPSPSGSANWSISASSLSVIRSDPGILVKVSSSSWSRKKPFSSRSNTSNASNKSESL